MAVPSLDPVAARAIVSAALASPAMRLDWAADRPEAWASALVSCPFVPVEFERDFAAYQLAWLESGGNDVVDLSFALAIDGAPRAAMSLALRARDGRVELGSNEGPVLPPLFVAEAGERLRKQIVAGILRAIADLCARHGIETWRSTSIARDPGGLGPWHRRLMEAGAQAELRHELVLDLTPDLETIRRSFRRSYKSLIGEAGRLWRHDIVAGGGSDAFDEFRALHLRAAGRVTRGDATWAAQKSAVERGTSFLVALRDADRALVGAALFATTRDEALYAVGAYDRALFDRPVGHLAQAVAIEHMKALGLGSYRLGARPYPGDVPPPTEKELSIAHFKEGFASGTCARLTLTVSARVGGGAPD